MRSLNEMWRRNKVGFHKLKTREPGHRNNKANNLGKIMGRGLAADSTEESDPNDTVPEETELQGPRET